MAAGGLVAWWQGRKFRQPSAPTAATDAVSPAQWAVSGVAALAILLLLAGVFTGRVFAVEAAATGAMALVVAILLSRSLSAAEWQTVLADTLSLSGALLALLVGASTFSLVFRLWGTDAWITQAMLASPLSPLLTTALVLVLVALCAWVLDAFEMIFVIIPIVAPPLIARLGDAQQTAVLLLLVLQLSFLIPPMGYAVMMARSRAGLVHVSVWQTLRALAPYIAVQCAVTAVVFLQPWTVHQLDAPLPAASEQAPALSAQDLDQQIRDMAEQAGALDNEKKP